MTTLAPPSPDPPALTLEVVSGPAVGPPHHLVPGTYVVGRGGRADIRLDDPAVEPHHLLVDVDPAGRTVAIQLTGRCPVLVDDRPLDGHGPLRAGQQLAVGATRLRLGPGPDHPDPLDPGGRSLGEQVTVVRSPRAVPVLTVPTIESPIVDEPPAGAGGHPGMLMGSVVGVVGGLVLALVTRSPLMLVMGVVAAGVSWSTWLIGRVRRVLAVRRCRRQQVDAIEEVRRAVSEASAVIRRHHERCHPAIARRLAAAPGSGLWERRPHHGDAFTVSIGRGDLERPLPTDAERLPSWAGPILDAAALLPDVEIPARLDAHERHVIAITGPGAHGVARSLVLQLATTTGPADWVLRAVLRSPLEHEWLRLLPHAGPDATADVVAAADDTAAVAALVADLDDGDERRVVLLCDAPALLTSRVGPLRRLLDGSRAVTIVLADEEGGPLPAVCRSVLRLTASGAACWTDDLDDLAAAEAWGDRRVRAAAVPARAAERVAARLARCVDPELAAATQGRAPRSVQLHELAAAGVLPWTVDEILTSWSGGGSDPAPLAIVGLSGEAGPGGVEPADVMELDLVRDGPHGLVAGTTGSGKSELLRTLVVSLAARTDPRLLSLVLVDYKGGATFDACADLPHTVGVVTDLDEGLAARVMISLDAELRRRERILRDLGAADLAAARSGSGGVALARLVVVIDEFAALAKELPGFLASLVDVAQRGRSLGIHLLLATQRPAGVIDDAIRANTNLRIALRLHDAADALDVVGDRLPAGFPRAIPGRAVARLGPDELVVFQAAACTTPDADGSAPTDLEVLVGHIRDAADRSGFEQGHRPWLPPLDDPSVPEPEPGSVGWVDDPADQSRRPLRWDHSGHLALVGAIGSGTTTTLLSLAVVAPVVHVIDGRGDRELSVLDSSSSCSGVIGVDDHERVDRLLRRLVATIDGRRSGRTPIGTVEVLLVDGFEAVRRSLDEPDRVDPDGLSSPSARLRRVLAEGPPVGVVVAAVVEPESGGASLARFHERWLFHVDDPAVAGLLGVPVGRIPPASPGRIVVASSGLEARLWPRVAIAPSPSPSPLPVAERVSVEARVAPVEVLPTIVTADDLSARVSTGEVGAGGDHGEPGARGVPIGQRFDDLGAVVFDWSPGDAVVVAGPRRSGRTTLLGHLVRSWQAGHPDGTVSVVGAQRAEQTAGRVASWGRSVELVELADLSRMIAPGVDAPLLVVVDDADRLDDRDGVLASLAAGRSGAGVTLLLAGRADALRSFDHWAAAARRRRTGFVMAATSELDGDVLGVAPPRRCPIAPRPGLAWMIAHGDCTLVQVLAPDGADAADGT